MRNGVDVWKFLSGIFLASYVNIYRSVKATEIPDDIISGGATGSTNPAR
jgi:hypothetical protein